MDVQLEVEAEQRLLEAQELDMRLAPEQALQVQ
jgi:hypothetical protein